MSRVVVSIEDRGFYKMRTCPVIVVNGVLHNKTALGAAT